MRWRARVLLCCVALLVLGYAGANGYLWVAQRQLIFEPSRDVLKTPAALHLRYQEVWLSSGADDQASLNGWWLPADQVAAPALLYLHGNDQNIGGNLEHVARLREIGLSVLIVDYRGYGKSGGGFPSETTVNEDAETAWNYLVRTLHADPQRTFIYGHSLGGAIAMELALRHPEAAGLIVESTFTSMRAMARGIYPLFPVGWLLNQHFDNLAEAGLLRVPVLFIHGKADTLVPYAMSERLYQAAPQPKRLLFVHGGGHEDSATVGGARYANAVRDFVQSVPAATEAAVVPSPKN